MYREKSGGVGVGVGFGGMTGVEGVFLGVSGEPCQRRSHYPDAGRAGF